MILAWIQRLRDNPSVVCPMPVPMWDCSPWWHLMRMHVKPSPLLILNPVKGLFNGCRGTPMSAPRWPVTCVVVSGQHWHSSPSQAIADYFVPLESAIKRYCIAFRFLWALAELRGFDVVKTAISDVAGLLLELHQVSPSQARKANMACLVFPQLQGLKFSILLKTVKRSWYKIEQRYATVYDATSVFCKFASQLLLRINVVSVCLRLILVWRFFGLYCGVELSRVYWVVSRVDGQGMVAVRRKGQKNMKFEKVCCWRMRRCHRGIC